MNDTHNDRNLCKFILVKKALSLNGQFKFHTNY